MKHLKLSFDRALSRGTKWQLLIISGIIIVLILVSYLLLSLSGDWTQFCDDHKINKFMLPIYLLIDQNLFNEIYLGGYDAEMKEIVGYSRKLALASGITFLFGVVFFNGAIIAILSDFIKRRVDNYQNGVTRYLKSGHHVIMGYDDVVPSIISSARYSRRSLMQIFYSYPLFRLLRFTKNCESQLLVNLWQISWLTTAIELPMSTIKISI